MSKITAAIRVTSKGNFYQEIEIKSLLFMGVSFAIPALSTRSTKSVSALSL